MTDFEWRYCTLAEARALECNQCGDCCDSTRLERPGNWAWGDLPSDLFSEFNDGESLIIPLMQADQEWRELPWGAWMEGNPRQSVPYRCRALKEQPDGTAICGLYDAQRPEACSTFPVWWDTLDDTMADGRVWRVPTGGLLRCTWYDMILVSEDDEILDFRNEDWSLPWADLSAEQQDYVTRVHALVQEPSATPETDEALTVPVS